VGGVYGALFAGGGGGTGDDEGAPDEPWAFCVYQAGGA
jgi:hypothetical protein